MNLSGSINFSYRCVRKVRTLRTQEVCKNEGIGNFLFFVCVSVSSPVLSDFNPMLLFFFFLFFSEYCPSADGGVVVVLDQMRLQMRRRVRG